LDFGQSAVVACFGHRLALQSIHPRMATNRTRVQIDRGAVVFGGTVFGLEGGAAVDQSLPQGG
jgi:hypothetical protein